MTIETNEERLERLKEDINVIHYHAGYEGLDWDLRWLIQQSERTQELEQLTNNMRRAMQTAYNNTASCPKASIKPFLLNTFRDYWEPELVEQLELLEGSE